MRRHSQDSTFLQVAGVSHREGVMPGTVCVCTSGVTVGEPGGIRAASKGIAFLLKALEVSLHLGNATGHSL